MAMGHGNAESTDERPVLHHNCTDLRLRQAGPSWRRRLVAAS